MTLIPDGYQIGEAERGYLRQLEEFKRQKIPLTPSDFCKKVGLADTSSIRRYTVLKIALNQYGWQTEPSRMRGTKPDLLQKVNLGDDPRIEKLEAKIDRLENRLAEAGQLRIQLKEREKDLGELRGLLMSLITHYSAADISRAQDIEQKLVKLVRERIPNEDIPDLSTGDSVTTDMVNKVIDEVQKDW